MPRYILIVFVISADIGVLKGAARIRGRENCVVFSGGRVGAATTSRRLSTRDISGQSAMP